MSASILSLSTKHTVSLLPRPAVSVFAEVETPGKNFALATSADVTDNDYDAAFHEALRKLICAIAAQIVPAE
jgi:hypothetical protein